MGCCRPFGRLSQRSSAPKAPSSAIGEPEIAVEDIADKLRGMRSGSLELPGRHRAPAGGDKIVAVERLAVSSGYLMEGPYSTGSHPEEHNKAIRHI